MADTFTCPHCGAVSPNPSPPIDWDLVQWRTAFRAASAANDAKIAALLLELRSEQLARKEAADG